MAFDPLPGEKGAGVTRHHHPEQLISPAATTIGSAWDTQIAGSVCASANEHVSHNARPVDAVGHPREAPELKCRLRALPARPLPDRYRSVPAVGGHAWPSARHSAEYE
jgi:hypothetical protein